MLDRALSQTFANLSTLFLVACVISIPVHVIHAYVFKDALAVQEIAPEIRSFPEGRQVRGVAKADLGAERAFLFVALGLELLAAPLVYRAARRVLDVDDEGGVPTAIDGWRHLQPGGKVELGPVLLAGAIGAVAGAIVWSIGHRVADMASADLAWVIFASGRAAGVALFLALVSGAAAALPHRETAPPKPVEKLDLY